MDISSTAEKRRRSEHSYSGRSSPSKRSRQGQDTFGLSDSTHPSDLGRTNNRDPRLFGRQPPKTFEATELRAAQTASKPALSGLPTHTIGVTGVVASLEAFSDSFLRMSSAYMEHNEATKAMKSLKDEQESLERHANLYPAMQEQNHICLARAKDHCDDLNRVFEQHQSAHQDRTLRLAVTLTNSNAEQAMTPAAQSGDLRAGTNALQEPCHRVDQKSVPARPCLGHDDAWFERLRNEQWAISDEFERLKNQSRTEWSGFDGKFKEMRADYDDLRDKLNTVNNRIVERRLDIDKLHDRVTGLSSETSKTTHKLEAGLKKLMSNYETIAAALQAVTDTSGAAKANEPHVRSIEENETLESKIEEHSELLNVINKQLFGVAEKNETGLLASCQQLFEERDELVKKFDNTIPAATIEHIANVTSMIESLQQSIHVISQNCEDLKQENTDFVEAQKAQDEHTWQEFEKVSTELQALRTRHDGLQGQVLEVREEVKNIGNRISELQRSAATTEPLQAQQQEWQPPRHTGPADVGAMPTGLPYRNSHSGYEQSTPAPLNDRLILLEQRADVLTNATQQLRERFDNLTTDDVCRSMVNQMKQMYPAPHNMQQAANEYRNSLAQFRASTNQVMEDIAAIAIQLKTVNEQIGVFETDITKELKGAVAETKGEVEVVKEGVSKQEQTFKVMQKEIDEIVDMNGQVQRVVEDHHEKLWPKDQAGNRDSDYFRITWVGAKQSDEEE
ncbi:hypothetical protein LTR66_011452 [Elasticomyces elasticus]|nr:hypothetical protein LTR66_011452 [Elasticomyces elasticus]